MKDFNYKGIIFQLKVIDEDEWTEVEAVYHKGEDLTKILSYRDLVDLEHKLNMQIAREQKRNRI